MIRSVLGMCAFNEDAQPENALRHITLIHTLHPMDEQDPAAICTGQEEQFVVDAVSESIEYTSKRVDSHLRFQIKFPGEVQRLLNRYSMSGLFVCLYVFSFMRSRQKVALNRCFVLCTGGTLPHKIAASNSVWRTIKEVPQHFLRDLLVS